MFQVNENKHIIQDSQILLSSTKINLGGKELKFHNFWKEHTKRLKTTVKILKNTCSFWIHFQNWFDAWNNLHIIQMIQLLDFKGILFYFILFYSFYFIRSSFAWRNPINACTVFRGAQGSNKIHQNS